MRRLVGQVQVGARVPERKVARGGWGAIDDFAKGASLAFLGAGDSVVKE